MLRVNFPRVFAACLGVLGLCRFALIPVGRAQAPAPTLTTAAEVRSLSVAAAESGLPAVIRGVIVFVESPSGLFLQDETSTTFFRTAGIPASALPIVGDEVEVRAKTRMGLYLPGLDYATIRHLGRRALPPGIPATYDDLYFGRHHYRRVTVEGVVRSVTTLAERNQQRSLIRVALGSRVLEARVDQPSPADRTLVDHRVRLTGLAAGFINARRQLVQPYIAVIGWSEVETLAPAPPAAAVPLVSAEDLLAFRVTGHGAERVRVEGVVTAVFSSRELYLQQHTHGFGVRLVAPASVVPGDRVAVVGFPEMERFSAFVADAELVQQAPGAAPEPIDLAGPEAVAGPLDATLVRLTGVVSDTHKSDTGSVLLVAGGPRAVHVRLPESAPRPAAGSRIRVTGICQVESAHGSTGFSSRPTLLGVRARSAADLEILRTPSWWTPQRLAATLATLAAITLLAALWIAALRRQVAHQTAALSARIQSEAALAERQRIAREFHDTLEQELAGVSLRLDALASRPLDDKGRNLIAAARNLVSRIQTETRDLIADLRDAHEISGDLASALEGVAARHAAESGADVRFENRSPPLPLPPAIVHDLRMIAREAITNALKHGRAARVRLELTREGAALVLRIIDNGCGFAPALDNKPGHFGCAGIRERARKLGASVAWRSELQRGATVEVTLPLEAAHADAASPGATAPAPHPDAASAAAHPCPPNLTRDAHLRPHR